MCIIIDADMVHRVFAEPSLRDYSPILTWIISKNGRLVYGGLNARQLLRCERASRTIQEWAKTGKAKRFEGVDEEEIYIHNNLTLESNDSHIIALARKSGARILCSMDKNLHKDFTNTRLVNSPQGKVYQDATHRDVLVHKRGCQNR